MNRKFKEMSWGQIIFGIMLIFIAFFFVNAIFYWIYIEVFIKAFGLPVLTFWQFLGGKILIENLLGGVNIPNISEIIDGEEEK